MSETSVSTLPNPRKANRPLSLGPIVAEPPEPPRVFDPRIFRGGLHGLVENYTRIAAEQATAARTLERARDAVPAARREDIAALADASVKGQKPPKVDAEARAQRAFETARRDLDVANAAQFRAGAAVRDYVEQRKDELDAQLTSEAEVVRTEALDLLALVEDRLVTFEFLRGHRAWLRDPVDGRGQVQQPRPTTFVAQVRRVRKPNGEYPTGADLIAAVRESLAPDFEPDHGPALPGGIPPGSIRVSPQQPWEANDPKVTPQPYEGGGGVARIMDTLDEPGLRDHAAET